MRCVERLSLENGGQIMVAGWASTFAYPHQSLRTQSASALPFSSGAKRQSVHTRDALISASWPFRWPPETLNCEPLAFGFCLSAVLRWREIEKEASVWVAAARILASSIGRSWRSCGACASTVVTHPYRGPCEIRGRFQYIGPAILAPILRCVRRGLRARMGTKRAASSELCAFSRQ